MPLTPKVALGLENEASKNDFETLNDKCIGSGTFGSVWKVRHKITNQIYAIDIFLIIDQFYGKIKKLDFLELIKEKQEEGSQDTFNLIKSINIEKNMNLKNFRYIYNFSHDEFENFYKDNLRAFINREQEDDKNIFIKEQYEEMQENGEEQNMEEEQGEEEYNEEQYEEMEKEKNMNIIN